MPAVSRLGSSRCPCRARGKSVLVPFLREPAPSPELGSPADGLVAVAAHERVAIELMPYRQIGRIAFLPEAVSRATNPSSYGLRELRATRRLTESSEAPRTFYWGARSVGGRVRESGETGASGAGKGSVVAEVDGPPTRITTVGEKPGIDRAPPAETTAGALRLASAVATSVLGTSDLEPDEASSRCVRRTWPVWLSTVTTKTVTPGSCRSCAIECPPLAAALRRSQLRVEFDSEMAHHLIADQGGCDDLPIPRDHKASVLPVGNGL